MKLQGTWKIGCPAHLNIHKIQLFPDFKIPAEDIARIGVRKLKERKCEARSRLQSMMTESNNLNMLTKHFVLLPTQEAHHSFHKTSGEVGFSQKIHPKLVEKVNELVSEGAVTQEVKRALKRHVHHVL